MKTQEYFCANIKTVPSLPYAGIHFLFLVATIFEPYPALEQEDFVSLPQHPRDPRKGFHCHVQTRSRHKLSRLRRQPCPPHNPIEFKKRPPPWHLDSDEKFILHRDIFYFSASLHHRHAFKAHYVVLFRNRAFTFHHFR